MGRLVRYAVLTVFLLAVPVTAGAAGGASSAKFVATYFYTNIRCPSCLTIERWTSQTIRDSFTDEIEKGTLVFRTVNIDGEGNFHYVKDYSLYTKSVILSEMDGDREVRWKNLPRVWELLRSESRFRDYVRTEVRAFMEPR